MPEPANPQSRYVVAFNGRRDEYQVAFALHEANALDVLFTDIYLHGGTADALSRIPIEGARKLARRNVRTLPSNHVRAIPFQTIGRRLLDRVSQPEVVWRALQVRDARLGAAAARRAREMGTGGVIYSYHWKGFLDAFGMEAPNGPRILFQVHPLPGQIRDVLTAERNEVGYWAQLEDEEKMLDGEVERYHDAVLLADRVIVASSFTRQGFLDLGYPAERIDVVPYGVERITDADGAGELGDGYAGEDGRDETRSPLKLLWVGQVTFRKGLHRLLDALRSFPQEAVELTIVGRTVADPTLITSLPPNVKFHHGVSSDRLDELYRTHDLFVLPSLIEGFGLVYLEAMARGLPILCTHNTGGPDILGGSEAGFIVAAGNTGDLVSALGYARAHQSSIRALRGAARTTAEQWTWRRFREGIASSVLAAENNNLNGSGAQ